MKKFLCFFMVVLLAALLVVPCFAAETTVDRGDPVDWFGSGDQILISYTFAVSDMSLGSSGWRSEFVAWLSAVGAVSSDTAVGSFGFTSGGTTYSDRKAFTNGTSVLFVKQDGSDEKSGSYTVSGSVTINSSLGFTEAQVITIAIVTPTYSGSDGFVDSGFSYALSELSTIVSAILSNQYILIAIGLAVAVPLVAWGISKIKSLVKGY